MFSLLFRNRWFAAAWAVLTVASASVFVGDGGGADRLAGTVQQLGNQRALLEKTETPMVSASVDAEAESAPERALLPLPGSDADPGHPQVGDVFLDPVTGQRVRAIRRDPVAEADAPSAD